MTILDLYGPVPLAPDEAWTVRRDGTEATAVLYGESEPVPMLRASLRGHRENGYYIATYTGYWECPFCHHEYNESDACECGAVLVKSTP